MIESARYREDQGDDGATGKDGAWVRGVDIQKGEIYVHNKEDVPLGS